jgi:hypothetical protein
MSERTYSVYLIKRRGEQGVTRTDPRGPNTAGFWVFTGHGHLFSQRWPPPFADIVNFVD